MILSPRNKVMKNRIVRGISMSIDKSKQYKRFNKAGKNRRQDSRRVPKGGKNDRAKYFDKRKLLSLSPHAEVVIMRDFKHTHLSQRTMSSKKCNTSTKKHSFSSEHSHKKIPLLFERTNRSVIPNLCKKSTKQILMKFLNRKKNNVDISTLIRSFNKVRSFSPPTKKTHAPKLRLFSEPKKKLFTRRERQDQQNMNEPAADFEESSLHVFGEMRHRNKQFDDLIPKVKMAKLRFFH